MVYTLEHVVKCVSIRSERNGLTGPAALRAGGRVERVEFQISNGGPKTKTLFARVRAYARRVFIPNVSRDRAINRLQRADGRTRLFNCRRI